MIDETVVPEREGRAQLRERASRFFAYAVLVESRDEATAALDRLRRHHHDATHVVFAWKLGTGDAAATRWSDAGEPAGTAGRPILAAIEAAGLSDVLVAIAREIGGTRLGTAGLVRAYGDAARGALRDAGRATRYETVAVAVACPPDGAGALRRLLDPPSVSLAEETWASETGEARATLRVRRSRLPALLRALEDSRLPYAPPGA